jgi:hypothetical protein
MVNIIAGQLNTVPIKYFGDWTERVAKGELPKSKPTRPQGEERNIVVTLRETFEARGRLQRDGSFRQWTNGNLQALLEPSATGHRLRLSTRKSDVTPRVLIGAAMLLNSAVILLTGVLGPNGLTTSAVVGVDPARLHTSDNLA